MERSLVVRTHVSLLPLFVATCAKRVSTGGAATSEGTISTFHSGAVVTVRAGAAATGTSASLARESREGNGLTAVFVRFACALFA